MAVVHAAPGAESRLARALTTDFCPWANRFVYWLKEPIGWFVLATAISVMIGMYFSPIGWTLAASLSSIIVVGMSWPFVAVHATRLGLQPGCDAVHEDTSCRIIVSVTNRFPIPVLGLVIEGYLDSDVGERVPTVGLACVPPLCVAEYSLTVMPQLRGHYPITKPQVTCSFPFGIWTARRALKQIRPLTVWPKVYPVTGICPLVGKNNADVGDGQRGGRSGDFVGVRQFRRGDSAKQVNWVASARSDSLIITERGGPQSVDLELWIDTRGDKGREPLARRVRVAASVLVSLHQSRLPTRLKIGDHWIKYSNDGHGRRVFLDALARIAADGVTCQRNAFQSNACQRSGTSSAVRIDVTGASDGGVLVRIIHPSGGRRAGGSVREIRIMPHDDISTAIANLWREVRDVDVAA